MGQGGTETYPDSGGIPEQPQYDQAIAALSDTKIGFLNEFYSDLRNPERNAHIREALAVLPEKRLLDNGGVVQKKEVYAKDIQHYLYEEYGEDHRLTTKNIGQMLCALEDAGKIEQVGASAGVNRYDITAAEAAEDDVLYTLHALSEE